MILDESFCRDTILVSLPLHGLEARPAMIFRDLSIASLNLKGNF
jgi:hypothetical protein